MDLSGYMSGMFGGSDPTNSMRNVIAPTQPYWNAGGAQVTPNAGSGMPASSQLPPLQPMATPTASQNASRVQPVPSYTPAPTSQSGMTNTSPAGTPWNVTQGGTGYDANGNPIGQYGNVTGSYTPPAAPTGAPTTGPGTPGYGTPASTSPSFTDPAYQQLNNLVTQRLGQLSQPLSFPILQQLQKLLGTAGPNAQSEAQTLADTLNTRAAQLQQPLLTSANVANEQALASNNILGQRDTALAASKANLAARGINPNTSGLQTDQANQINQQYGNEQAQTNAQLQESQIQGDEARRNESTQLSSLATQALQGGDLTAIQDAAQNADLENQLFNIGNNQANTALTTAQIPVDLTNQGFSNALNASMSTTNPLASIMQLLGLGNQQQGLQQQSSNSNASALAWLLQQALA